MACNRNDSSAPSRNGRYTDICRTLGDAELRQLDRIMDHPKVELQLLSLASDELVRAQEHLLILGRKTATERLASVLIRLVRRIGRHDRDGWRVDLPMTRTDLADYIGLTTETVSRTFAYLRSEGVVDTYGVRSLLVPRVKALASYSGDA